MKHYSIRYQTRDNLSGYVEEVEKRIIAENADDAVSQLTALYSPFADVNIISVEEI